MTLTQQPGNKKLLILKTKTRSFKKKQIFLTLRAHFFIENSPIFLFLGKQEPYVNK